MHGRYINNSAPILLLHMGQTQPGGMEDTRQIDSQDSVPLRHSKRVHGRNVLDPSIIDQDVNSIELLLYVMKECLNAFHIAQISTVLLVHEKKLIIARK